MVRGGPGYQDEIEKIAGELTQVIEEFESAISLETLCSAKRIGKLSLYNFGFGDGAFSTALALPQKRPWVTCSFVFLFHCSFVLVVNPCL